MAFVSGTATSNIDLWNKLVAFLTTNVSLVSAGEAWTVAWTHASGQPSGVVLRGPGSSSGDDVFVGMRRFDSGISDQNYIEIMGCTGVSASATQLSGHMNPSYNTRIFLDGGAMKYWFVANGRRFIVVVNMSTVYQVAYCGFFLPYANPLVYPYPLFIGGCAPGSGAPANAQVATWRTQVDWHAAFPFAPYNTLLSVTAAHRSSAYVIDQAGIWKAAGGSAASEVSHLPVAAKLSEPDGTTPWSLLQTSSAFSEMFGLGTIADKVIRGLGDTVELTPFTLVDNVMTINMMGILQGVYWTHGVSNAVENIVQVGGVDHLVLQNVYRTAVGQYFAIALE